MSQTVRVDGCSRNVQNVRASLSPRHAWVDPPHAGDRVAVSSLAGAQALSGLRIRYCTDYPRLISALTVAWSDLAWPVSALHEIAIYTH